MCTVDHVFPAKEVIQSFSNIRHDLLYIQNVFFNEAFFKYSYRVQIEFTDSVSRYFPRQFTSHMNIIIKIKKHAVCRGFLEFECLITFTFCYSKNHLQVKNNKQKKYMG